LLRAQLLTRDPLLIRSGLKRWIKVMVVWQVLVLGLCGLYLISLGSSGGHSFASISPAIGAIFGTALPLQFVVMAILRSLRT
jgi:hypothetical protein